MLLESVIATSVTHIALKSRPCPLSTRALHGAESEFRRWARRSTDDLVAGPDGQLRCRWATAAPEYVAYHDDEWGRPVLDDRGLYEKLCLEAFQSGLSWITILRKREAFRSAFAGFEIEPRRRLRRR